MKGKNSNGSGKKRILSQRKKWENALTRRSEATSLGSAIQQLVQLMNVRDIIAEQSVINRWEKVVGERIAGVTEPRSIKKGILKVKVSNQAWRQELVYLKDDIVKKLNDDLEERFVSDIVFS